MGVRVSTVTPPHRAPRRVLARPSEALPLRGCVQNPLGAQAVQGVPEALHGPLHLSKMLFAERTLVRTQSGPHLETESSAGAHTDTTVNYMPKLQLKQMKVSMI